MAIFNKGILGGFSGEQKNAFQFNRRKLRQARFNDALMRKIQQIPHPNIYVNPSAFIPHTPII